MTLSKLQAFGAAIVIGALLWQGTATASGQREAWDSSLYWTIAYPLGMIAVGWIAYMHPHRSWRWALALMWIQPVIMVLTSGSDFGLLPLGLILFTFLAIPMIAVANVAGKWRIKSDARKPA